MLASELLDLLIPMGKWPIFSSYLTPWLMPSFYNSLVDLMEQKGGMYYVEYFCVINNPALCLQQVLMFMDLGMSY